jgi:hypothetical protein
VIWFRWARRPESRRPCSTWIEDGFHTLFPHATHFIEELLSELERNDHGLRCWLLELICEAKDPRALRVLVEQLHEERDCGFDGSAPHVAWYYLPWKPDRGSGPSGID